MMFKLTMVVILSGLLQISYADEAYIHIETRRPADFVNLKAAIPQIQVDMRYYGSYNFVGQRITGYQEPICLLTQKAVNALQIVETQLLTVGLTLKVYDCYRPQMAVDSFVDWAESIKNTKMQKVFYPKVDKKNLFKENYIAYQSGHSRGSTLDLTIVPLNSLIPKYSTDLKASNCNPYVKNRPQDNSLDFGSGFDCFELISHPDFQGVSAQARANRLLLLTLMAAAGFHGLSSEWWHFTLKDEPYPETFFNFPVKSD